MESQVTTPHKQIHQRSQSIPFIEFLNLTSKWIIKSQRALLTQPSFKAQHTLQRGSQPSNQGIHPLQLLVYASYHDFWILPRILLMQEIPHHLTCMKPCKIWDLFHINWFRILSTVLLRFRYPKHFLSFPHPASNARLLNLQRQDLEN